MTPAAVEAMPKKASKEPVDYIVRLPPEYRDMANKLRAATGRAATVCVQIAIEQACRDHHISVKGNWPNLLRQRD